MIKKSEYKIEDLFLLNNPVIGRKSVNGNWQNIYEVEQFSLEEKLLTLDDFTDGIATYILNLTKKYFTDIQTMPKGTYNTPKTVSVKAWVKKNDTRKIISTYNLSAYTQKYSMFGKEHQELSLGCKSSKFGYDMIYTGENVIQQWFHDFIIQQQKGEREYFKNNDSHQLKLATIIESKNTFLLFGCKILDDIIWNSGDAADEQLDYFIKLNKEMKEIYAEKQLELDNFLEQNK